MIKLNIITVWYNEEKNLPKLCISLVYLKSKIHVRHIYIDQESNDNSCDIMNNYSCEIYKHKNLWYADPDKKWAVENLLSDNDWCLILDADEELTENLSDEIRDHIHQKKQVWIISLSTFFLWIKNGTFKQIRLFQKKSVIITEEIHNYTHLVKWSESILLKHEIINKDLKTQGNEVFSHIKKQLYYAENEIPKYENISDMKLYFYFFWKPIQWFFWWGIVHKLFLKWTAWFIYAGIMAYYQFTIFALLYERRKNKENMNISS